MPGKGTAPRPQLRPRGVEPHESDEVIFHLPEQVEKPQAEGDAGVDEVREPQHQEIEPQPQLRSLEELELGGQVDRGYLGEVVVQAVEQRDEHRNGETHPHAPVAEERRNHPTILPLLEHGQRHLGHGIGEPLVFHPLPSQNGQHRDQHQVERRVEQQPRQQPRQPGVPGNTRLPPGPLVEPLDRLRIADQGPLSQVRMQQFGPLVLGTRVVVRAGDHRQQHAGHPARGNGRGHHHHGHDGDQFPARQRLAPPAPPQQQMDSDHQREEQEESRRRGRGETHRRPPQQHGGVRRADRNRNGHQSAHHYPAHGDRGTRTGVFQKLPALLEQTPVIPRNFPLHRVQVFR